MPYRISATPYSRFYAIIFCCGCVFSLLDAARALDRCNFNIYNSDTFTCGTAHKENSPRLLSLYSQKSKKSEMIDQSLKIKILSENNILSEQGPDSAASLIASCGPQSTPFMKLVFPGYPMFVENNVLNVTMVFKNTRRYNFKTTSGNDMFEMIVEDHHVLKQITSSMLAFSSDKVSFVSKDQEGSLIKADFDYSDYGPQISNFENTCL